MCKGWCKQSRNISQSELATALIPGKQQRTIVPLLSVSQLPGRWDGASVKAQGAGTGPTTGHIVPVIAPGHVGPELASGNTVTVLVSANTVPVLVSANTVPVLVSGNAVPVTGLTNETTPVTDPVLTVPGCKVLFCICQLTTRREVLVGDAAKRQCPYLGRLGVSSPSRAWSHPQLQHTGRGNSEYSEQGHLSFTY